MAIAGKKDPLKKQKDTLNFRNNAVQRYASDTVSKPKLGKQIYETPERTTPDRTDSIAVYRSNRIRKEMGMDSSWSDIADHAESKFGKIDVSNYKPPKSGRGGTSGDAYRKRKEYGLNKKKK